MPACACPIGGWGPGRREGEHGLPSAWRGRGSHAEAEEACLADCP